MRFMSKLKGFLSKKSNNVAARTRSLAGSTSMGVMRQGAEVV